MSDSGTGSIDRERLVEEFGEEKVQHTEWWSEEMTRVEEVMAEVVEAIEERDDVQLARRGRSVGRDGVHTGKFRLKIAGEPWDGVSSEDE